MGDTTDEVARAVGVARRLADELREEPAITLVDVGRNSADELCVRVHVREGVDGEPPPSLPSRVEGLPVVPRHGDYELHDE